MIQERTLKDTSQLSRPEVIRTIGIDHVAFYVPDLAEALEFFVTMLGCEQVDGGGALRPR